MQPSWWAGRVSVCLAVWRRRRRRRRRRSRGRRRRRRGAGGGEEQEEEGYPSAFTVNLLVLTSTLQVAVSVHVSVHVVSETEDAPSDVLLLLSSV